MANLAQVVPRRVLEEPLQRTVGAIDVELAAGKLVKDLVQALVLPVDLEAVNAKPVLGRRRPQALPRRPAHFGASLRVQLPNVSRVAVLLGVLRAAQLDVDDIREPVALRDVLQHHIPVSHSVGEARRDEARRPEVSECT